MDYFLPAWPDRMMWIDVKDDRDLVLAQSAEGSLGCNYLSFGHHLIRGVAVQSNHVLLLDLGAAA